MKNRVLITSVGRKVGLIKEFVKAGWHVTGQDNDLDSVALKFCDDIALPDRENGPFDLILPTRDAELKIGTHRASDEIIDICTDKFKFYRWCKANRFNTPEVYFVKPRVSASGKEMECVWQEYLEGEEFSVDCFGDLNGTVISVVPRKRNMVVNGESCISTTVKDEQILALAVTMYTSLGLLGHVTMQCFKNGQTIYWTDVNLRFGGASVLSIMAGCKSPEWYLKLINGEKVEPCIGEYKIGLIGKSYTEWTFEN